MPIVTRIPAEWHNVTCSAATASPGTSPTIAFARSLSGMTNAKAACETLLQEALDGGGSDNITIVIGRVVPARTAPAACGRHLRDGGAPLAA